MSVERSSSRPTHHEESHSKPIDFITAAIGQLELLSPATDAKSLQKIRHLIEILDRRDDVMLLAPYTENPTDIPPHIRWVHRMTPREYEVLLALRLQDPTYTRVQGSSDTQSLPPRWINVKHELTQAAEDLLRAHPVALSAHRAQASEPTLVSLTDVTKTRAIFAGADEAKKKQIIRTWIHDPDVAKVATVNGQRFYFLMPDETLDEGKYAKILHIDGSNIEPLLPQDWQQSLNALRNDYASSH